MRKKERSNNVKLGVVVLLLMITIGYAILSTNLTINGTSKINNSTWDIHFENYDSTANSTVLPAEGKAPDTSGNNKTTISYEVEFNEPGDIYEFNIDAVNGGSIDGEIEKITSTLKIGNNDVFTIADDYSNLPEYLNYYVVYSDNEPVSESHELASGDSIKITVHIEFKKDITNEQYEAIKGATLYFNHGMNTIQSSRKTVIAPSKNYYVVTTSEIKFGYELPKTLEPEEAVLRLTAREAANDWTSYYGDEGPFYLKILTKDMVGWFSTNDTDMSGKPYESEEECLEHNSSCVSKNLTDVLKEGYVEFVVDNDMAENNEGMVPNTYTIRGGVNEQNLEDKPVFDANKEVLFTAFDYENHPDRCSVSNEKVECYDSTFLTVYVYTDGSLRAYNNDYNGCSVTREYDVWCN